MLEIGPGTGNLTRHLIAAGAQVTAVEKDHRLVDQLREEFGEVRCGGAGNHYTWEWRAEP